MASARSLSDLGVVASGLATATRAAIGLDQCELRVAGNIRLDALPPNCRGSSDARPRPLRTKAAHAGTQLDVAIRPGLPPPRLASPTSVARRAA